MQFAVRSRGRADLLLALAAGIEMQLELLFVEAPRRDILAARGLMLVLAAALALRRRTPLVASALAFAVLPPFESLDEAVGDGTVVPFFALLFMSYSLGANTAGRRLACGVAILLAIGMAAILLDHGSADDVPFLSTIMIGGPLLLGRAVRDRARLSRALREKAAALEADRAARRTAAVSRERARVAGELHELVSSAIAAMVAEADTAERLARSEPAAAAAALAAIETRGREALGEIRLLLGVLRRADEDAALEPVPSLAHLAELVARTRAAGLPVELQVDGDAPPLAAGLDVTAYGGELVAEPLRAGGHAVRARLPLERA